MRQVLRQITSLFVAVVLALSAFGAVDFSKAYAFASGDGSEANPYRIATCAQLFKMNEHLDAHYLLTASVDCSFDQTVITGTSAAPFTGSFNGGGFTISNITYSENLSDLGLFGYTSEATITNVKLDNITIGGVDNVGALVGFTYQTNISYVSVVNSSLWGTGQHIGGIVGYLGGSSVTRSFVENSDITGDSLVGGVAGLAIGPSTITNSYFQGALDGASLVGGVTGQAGAGPAIVANTYADATFADAGSDVVGQTAFGATLSNNFMASAPYLGNSTQAPLNAWDFTSIWEVRAGQYPGLLDYPDFLCQPPTVTDTSVRAQCGTDIPLTGTTTWSIKYAYSDSLDTQALPDQVGLDFDATATGLLPGTDYDVLFRFSNTDIGTSAWAKVQGTTTGNSDVDGDGTSNKDEALSPNNGDADNDGTQDYLQANVTSKPSFITGKYIVLKHTCTDNFNVQLGLESSTDADKAFDYPAGLLGFIARGCAVGATVPVEVYFYGSYQPGDLVARKSSGAVYTTLPGATMTTQTIGGEPVLKLAYSITDGSVYDDDGAADGNIVDPVGLGSSTLAAPNTGIGPR